MSLHRLTDGYNTISIIGMEKNVGKTTVMNAILEESRGRVTLGLTSIGRDGEDRDRVTNTHKPKIWIERGTLLATAKEALFNSDITREILATTGISTPMGEVVIVRALTDGYVDLAGPSVSSQISTVRDMMMRHEAQLVIVDGALGRMGTTYIDPESAAILSTGASLGSKIDEVVDRTIHRTRLLRLPRIDEDTFGRYIEAKGEGRVTFIGERDRSLILTSVLEADKEIVDTLEKGDTHLFIEGAVVPSLVERLIRSRSKFKRLSLIAQDGTKFFIDESLMRKAGLCGIEFWVCREINLTGVTCNPVSPFGYEFDPVDFRERLQKRLDIPVIDVIGGRDEISGEGSEK